MSAMFDGVPAVAAVFAGLAATIHVCIFVLESVLWTTPRVRATFGVASAEEALATRELAYNQGWYNLFLALGAVGGILLATLGHGSARAAGTGMMLLATASMVGAALVLVTHRPALARAAAVQGLAPLVAVAATVVLR